MMLSKEQWVLLLLLARPLDRIRLMKALFLFWNRSGENIPSYFRFEPYLYGPCSFEVYSVLDNLARQALVAQPPHPIDRWATYYLTERGKAAAESAAIATDPSAHQQLKEVAEEVSQLGFYELLRKVYDEAPAFAVNSVLRGAGKR